MRQELRFILVLVFGMLARQMSAQAVDLEQKPSKQKHFIWTLEGLEKIGETESRTIGVLQNGKMLVQQKISGDVFEFDLDPKLVGRKTVQVLLIGKYTREGKVYSAGEYYRGDLELLPRQIVYMVRQQTCGMTTNPFK